MVPKKILIIDDDPVVVKLLETRLRASGFSICSAANGVAGLGSAIKESPDLIIADYLMPKMDGFAFYKNLKMDRRIAKIPVLILTERPQMEESFRALGIEVFVSKPFMMEGLLSRISSLLATKAESDLEPRQLSHKKVLVGGTISFVVQDMVLQLQAEGCKTVTATTGMDTLTKAMEFEPDLIILEASMGDAPAHKVIKILRNLPRLVKKEILVYSYFDLKGMGNVSVGENAVSDDYQVSVCMAAGANEYLGRFSEAVFIDMLSKYL